MQAIELVRSPQTREPAEEETKEILRYCYERGLIVLPAGSYSNVVRLLAPLVITDEQFDEALQVLEMALETIQKARMLTTPEPAKNAKDSL